MQCILLLMKTTTAANKTLRTAHMGFWKSLSTADRAAAREVLAYTEAHHRVGLRASHPMLTYTPVMGQALIHHVDQHKGSLAVASSMEAANYIVTLVRIAAQKAGVADA